MHLDLGFGFFFGGGGVWVFCVYSRLVFVLLMLYDHALHSKCIIDLCAWLSLLWALIGLVWVSPIRSLFLHVICSCIHSFPSFLFWTCIVFYSFFFISLSLDLSLSWIEPIYGTQIEKIHSASESLSRFWVIFFCSSYYSLSYPVPWWEGQDGLLWELPRLWRSFGTLGNFVGFCRHSSFRSYSDLELGISTWETHEVSRCVYSGVLLQHTWHRYRCASVCYYIQRYTYCSYFGSYIRGAMHL